MDNIKQLVYLVCCGRILFFYRHSAALWPVRCCCGVGTLWMEGKLNEIQSKRHVFCANGDSIVWVVVALQSTTECNAIRMSLTPPTSSQRVLITIKYELVKGCRVGVIMRILYLL